MSPFCPHFPWNQTPHELNNPASIGDPASSGVARNLPRGVCKVVLPLASLPFPFPPLFAFLLLLLRIRPLKCS